MLPPEPQAYRVANKTDYVGDILVPKGTNIMIPVRLSILTTKRCSMLNTFRFVSSTLVKVSGVMTPKSMSLSY